MKFDVFHALRRIDSLPDTRADRQVEKHGQTWQLADEVMHVR